MTRGKKKQAEQLLPEQNASPAQQNVQFQQYENPLSQIREEEEVQEGNNDNFSTPSNGSGTQLRRMSEVQRSLPQEAQTVYRTSPMQQPLPPGLPQQIPVREEQEESATQEQLQNQEFLDREVTSGTDRQTPNRPSRNQRMTQVESEVQRLSQQLNEQSRTTSQKIEEQNRSLDNICNMLYDMRNSMQNTQILSQGQNNVPSPNRQNNVFSRNFGVNRSPQYMDNNYSHNQNNFHQERNNRAQYNQNLATNSQQANPGVLRQAVQENVIQTTQPIPQTRPQFQSPIHQNASSAQVQTSQNPQQMVVKVARNIQLKNYNGEENPVHWLRQFVKHCDRTEVLSQDQLDEVRDYLTGRAAGWFDRNYDMFQQEYAIFQNMFEKAFKKDPDIVEAQLLNTKQNNEEDLRSYVRRLENIAKPANLEEKRIKQAFLMGIKDTQLQNYARQFYQYLNKDVPLEQVLMALQDQEIYYKQQNRRMYTPSTTGSYTRTGYKPGEYGKPRETPTKGDGKTPSPPSKDSKTYPPRGGTSRVNIASEEQTPEGEKADTGSDEIADINERGDLEEQEHHTAYDHHTDILVINESEYQGSDIIGKQINKLQDTDTKPETFEEKEFTHLIARFQNQIIDSNKVYSDLEEINEIYNIQTNPLYEEHDSTCTGEVQGVKISKTGQGCEAQLSRKSVNLNQQSVLPQEEFKKEMLIQKETNPYVGIFSLSDTTEQKGSQGNTTVTTPQVHNGATSSMPSSKVHDLKQNQVLRYINIKINNISVNALVDTGCTSVILTMSFVMSNNLNHLLVQRYRQLTTATSSTVELRDVLPKGRINFREKELSNLTLQADMMIVPHNTSFQVIIGQSFLNFFTYQIAQNGLYLQQTQQANNVFIPYVSEMIYQVIETDLNDYGVLFKDSVILSKDQQELYPLFPRDKRDIILIDPPWTYFRNHRDIKTPQYLQLTFPQLQQLPIREIQKEDGILLMWVTSPMLKQAISLINSYGYMYKTVLFVWVKLDADNKPQQGKGNYSSPCCEYLLLSTKGNFLQYLQPDIKISQLIQEKNLKSSRKPLKIYAALESVFKLKEFNNLEIFSIAPKGSELFSHYGNNVPGRYLQSTNLSREQILVLNEEYQIINQAGEIKNADKGPDVIKRPESIPKQELENIKQDNTNVQLNQEELSKPYEKETLLSEDQVLSQVTCENDYYRDFLKNQATIFSRGDADLGETDVVRHRIQLKDGSLPKRQRPYHVGKLESEVIKTLINDIVEIGVIRSESSPYQHPIVLVRKANGKYRMCINYKYLNSQTIDDKYPIPLIRLLFTMLAGGKVFTKLDGKSGFWQVLMELMSIHLTGFVSQEGQYVFVRMPFGLKNAPATFQRLMNTVLAEYINDFVIVYIDDVIVYSPDHATHKIHLEKVFNKIREAKIKLGADKCVIGVPEMDILGHTVSHNEIRPQKEKVRAIKEIAMPANVTELRAFLGLCSYYRQYIKQFARKAHILFPLIGRGIPFIWKQEHTDAVEDLKNSLAENAVLQLLLNDKPLVLYTDFSILGLGAVLAQKVGDRKEKVIEFASRTLQKYERSLDSYCGEVLAVYWAVNKFRQYILSVPFSLEIVTDNKALEWVLKLGTSSPVRKIQRWTMEIDSYSYHIRHRKGTSHVNADALSRLVGQILEELQPSIPMTKSETLLYMEDTGDLACKHCGSTHENDVMVICDRCGDANHISCIGVQSLNKGPFYCPDCTDKINTNQDNDIIYNQKLYEYLRNCPDHNNTTEVDSEQVKQMNLSRNETQSFQQYTLVEERLFKYMNDNMLVLIPTEVERQIILKEQHHLCGHGGINRTLSKIQEQYWWKHMSKDVNTHVKSCEICNITKPVFSQQQELHTSQKDWGCFQILATDLITNLSDSNSLSRDIEDAPLTDEQVIDQRTRNKTRQANLRKKSNVEQLAESQDNYKHCIVVIDVFSKYVELGALKTKSSEEICRWFDQNIICRYGSPFILRSDQGTEFMGALKVLCNDHSIEMRTISSHHPQANGQAEATVKIVTSILRKFLLSKHYQYLKWWEILPYVQRSINISKTSATQYTPHEILYGRKMNQTDSVNYTIKEFSDNFPELTPQVITEYVTKLQASLQDLTDRVKVQLRKQDERMVTSYQKKYHREFDFQKGQRVYLQKLRTNKLEPRVLGPYIFEKYTDNKIRADVINPDNGKIFRFNTNTLSPASIIQFIYF